MADKALVTDAFSACHVAHTFIADVGNDRSLYSAGVLNEAWRMFKEAGNMLQTFIQDMQHEEDEWDCGHDVWPCDEDL